MSRIGKKPIPLPKGIKVEIDGMRVKVTGPNGMLERDIRPEVSLVEENGELCVSAVPGSGLKNDAFLGLTRSLVNNMVVGVDKGFEKKLVVEGVGYKADMAGNAITLNVGYSNPVIFNLPDEVKAQVDTKSNKITLASNDKELLGLTAARIRAIRKPEPYKGKGIRYENEHIVRKVGKAGAK